MTKQRAPADSASAARAASEPARKPRGRPRTTELRRDEIVDAFLSVMAREGYARATIAKIARDAGLAPGLLHYHFASKQEILVALVARLVARVGQRAQARVVRAGGDARRALFALVDAHVERGDDADPRAVAAWVVVGAEALRDGEVRALYVAAIERTLFELRAAVADVLRGDGRVTRNAARIAAAIVAAIEGAYRVAAAAPGVLPEGFAAPMLRRMIEGMVAAEDAA